MNIITLDFWGIRSCGGLHEYLKEVFQLPDYYGYNLDALWDCLSCCYDHSTTIILKNLSSVSEELVPEAGRVLELFRELEREDGINVVIENAPGFDR